MGAASATLPSIVRTRVKLGIGNVVGTSKDAYHSSP